MVSKEFLDKMAELGQLQEEAEKEYNTECEEYWNKLSKEEQLKAFYSVVKRICDGELKQKGSYRYILYDVFGFGPEAYGVGMQCGFLDLHNRIDTDR